MFLKPHFVLMASEHAGMTGKGRLTMHTLAHAHMHVLLHANMYVYHWTVNRIITIITHDSPFFSEKNCAM